MTTFTDVVASVVLHSSALAFSHFGVTLAPVQVEHAPPPAAATERVVARSPRRMEKAMACPQHRQPEHGHGMNA
jgi:hypothetical protein